MAPKSIQEKAKLAMPKYLCPDLHSPIWRPSSRLPHVVRWDVDRVIYFSFFLISSSPLLTCFMYIFYLPFLCCHPLPLYFVADKLFVVSELVHFI